MNTYQKLTELLSTDLRFVSDTGQLLKNKIVEQAFMLDSDLIKLLLSDSAVKKHFFTDVEGVLIFDKIKFQHFVNNKEFLPGSYTSFKNKIGLTSGHSEYLSDSNDVVLAWPYKDCVLEGGQDKEDAKRQEVFYNEILAPDEVDRLTAAKVLTNFKKYTQDGQSSPDGVSSEDSLIIKGNNLLTLHTLTPRYAGKIKLIYIDPPYGTDDDSFRYNDSFKRTTLLTFLRNRIEAAKSLLAPDGFIVIQGSFHHAPYIKVMCDELFGEDCWRTTFNVLVRHPDRSLTGDKEFNDVVEYAMVYSRNSTQRLPFIEEEKVDDDYIYEVFINASEPDDILSCDGKTVEVYLPSSYSTTKGDPDSSKLKTISIRGSLREKNSSGRFYVKHIEGLRNQYPELTLFKVPDMGDDAFGYRYFHLPKSNNKNGTYFQGMPQSSDVTKRPIANYLNFVEEYNIVNNEGGVTFRNGKKPEEYIKFFVDLLTQPNDIVMDFFAGSGTTAAVAHKLNRRFITLEQMDYVEDVTCGRLLNVLNGEMSGISGDIDWKGGGSFIYCELLKSNEEFVSQIQHADSTSSLMKIWSDMKARAFLSYQVDPKSIDQHAGDFADLSLDDQKRFLIEILDKNMLYVPYSEIDDETYAISDQDKSLNKQFFGGK